MVLNENLTDTIHTDTDSKIGELKYIRHGPVVFEDREKQPCLCCESCLMGVMFPYLASFRMDQVKLGRNLKRCNYSHIQERI